VLERRGAACHDVAGPSWPCAPQGRGALPRRLCGGGRPHGPRQGMIVCA
jgi:hypothetical protein